MNTPPGSFRFISVNSRSVHMNHSKQETSDRPGGTYEADGRAFSTLSSEMDDIKKSLHSGRKRSASDIYHSSVAAGGVIDETQSSNHSIYNRGKVRRAPCKARGMSEDHNSSTAFFEIPHDAKHGLLLSCTHPECAQNNRRFRYCAVCEMPAAKRNFIRRHAHGLVSSSYFLDRDEDEPSTNATPRTSPPLTSSSAIQSCQFIGDPNIQAGTSSSLLEKRMRRPDQVNSVTPMAAGAMRRPMATQIPSTDALYSSALSAASLMAPSRLDDSRDSSNLLKLLYGAHQQQQHQEQQQQQDDTNLFSTAMETSMLHQQQQQNLMNLQQARASLAAAAQISQNTAASAAYSTQAALSRSALSLPPGQGGKSRNRSDGEGNINWDEDDFDEIFE